MYDPKFNNEIKVGAKIYATVLRKKQGVDKFGNDQWDIQYNGQNYCFTTKGGKSDFLQSLFTQGNTYLEFTRDDIGGGKTSINFEPAQASNNTAQPVQPKEQRVVPMNEPDYSQDPQAQPDIREIKMGRGACWNSAVNYVLTHEPSFKMSSGFLERVKEIAELMVIEQRKFINNIKL